MVDFAELWGAARLGGLVIVKAMQIRVSDLIADGRAVTAVTRAHGQTYIRLEDGNVMECPDQYILGITRIKNDKGPEVSPEALSVGDYAVSTSPERRY